MSVERIFASKLNQFLKEPGILLLVLSCTALILYPLLTTGFQSDDVFLSMYSAGLKLRGITPLQAFTEHMQYEFVHEGRFRPLFLILFPLTFSTFQSLGAYKLYILFLCLLDSVLFYICLRRIGANVAFAGLATFISSLCFQMRDFFDPFTGFYGWMQLVFALTILSLLFFNEWLSTGKRKYLIISLIAFGLNLLFHEISYSFILLQTAVIFLRKERISFLPSLVSLLPFLLLASIALVGGIGLKCSAHLSANSSYAIGPNPIDITTTFLKQIFAALPLSYATLNPFSIYPAWTDIFSLKFIENCLQQTNGYVFCTVVCAFLIASLCLSDATMFETSKRWFYNRLFVLALLLIILPALPIALCYKYQRMLIFGIGYLPGYLEYFGFGLLTACLISWFLRATAHYKLCQMVCLPLLILNISVIAGLTANANMKVCQQTNTLWLFPRINMEQALKAGILDYVPEEATLSFSAAAPWINGAPWEGRKFFFMHSNKRFAIKNSNDIYEAWDGPFDRQQVESSEKSETKRHALQNEHYKLLNLWMDRNNGLVLLSKQSFIAGRDTVTNELNHDENLRLFVRGNALLNSSQLHNFLNQKKLSENIAVLTTGPGWSLYTFKNLCN